MFWDLYTLLFKGSRLARLGPPTAAARWPVWGLGGDAKLLSKPALGELPGAQLVLANPHKHMIANLTPHKFLAASESDG